MAAQQEIRTIKLPVTGSPYRNTDETELDQVNAAVQDAYVDEAGYTQKRPGLTEWADLGTSKGIDGLYWWDEQSQVIAVSNGQTYRHTDYTGTNTEITGASHTVGNRVSFDTDGTNLFTASGGAINYFGSSGNYTVMADADAPTDVTHLGFIDGYLVACRNNTGTWAFAGPNTPTSWLSIDVATAEAKPDVNMAIHVGLDGIAIFGKTTTEFWVNDGVSPFSRVRGLTLDRGCAAKYSVARDPQGDLWFWLDDRRHISRWDGRSATTQPCPYYKLIDGFSSVSDALADTVKIAGVPFYVLTFPLAGKTFAYNYRDETWAEWGYWNTSTAMYGRFRGNAYCYAKAWNLHLIGDYTNGKIYTMSRSVFQDDGDPIRSFRRTGHVSHGTNKRKRCRMVRIRQKRGLNNSDVNDPQMMVRWRNDNGAWGNEHQISLGQEGQHELISKLRNVGIYRTRQWEFIHSDASDWVLMEAEEDCEVLAS